MVRPTYCTDARTQSDALAFESIGLELDDICSSFLSTEDTSAVIGTESALHPDLQSTLSHTLTTQHRRPVCASLEIAKFGQYLCISIMDCSGVLYRHSRDSSKQHKDIDSTYACSPAVRLGTVGALVFNRKSSMEPTPSATSSSSTSTSSSSSSISSTAAIDSGLLIALSVVTLPSLVRYTALLHPEVHTLSLYTNCSALINFIFHIFILSLHFFYKRSTVSLLLTLNMFNPSLSFIYEISLVTVISISTF